MTLCEIKNTESELELKVGEKPYFGVISVGDLSTLKKHLTPHIPLKTDGL